MRSLRIALVHDWLTGFRGGERVLDHLAARFPNADLYTLIHAPGSTTARIESRRIVTSPLDRLPGSARHYRKLLPLFPWAIQRFDFSGYDLVLSTSHAVAKSIRVPETTPHLDYCFTPMRYIWDQADAYLGQGPRRWLSSPLLHALRRFDVATSSPDHVTRFVAISSEVADRIRRHYGREARVVAPPVDLSWIEPASSPPEDFYLLVAGFVPYKRDAIAIETFRGLDRKLVVVGDGPTRRGLERSAPPNVEFVGRVDDPTLADLYRRARALIYPQREDFGLVAVEAQGAGRPVIAFGAGGVLDTVRPLPEAGGESPLDESDATGVFFHQARPEALAEAIERFEKSEALFEPSRLRRWANRFSPSRFDTAFDRELAAVLERRGP
jgi:glycosyltransferase involved in cell wall biosynthesis